jgi:protein disulfide-isomerase
MKVLKSAFTLIIALMMIGNLSAQVIAPGSTPGSVEEAYTATKEGWLVSLEEAYAKASKENKPILANFTGSDWCGWCKRLDQSVFHKPDFQEWAKENVVLLELDFPRRFRVPAEVAQQNEGIKNSFARLGVVRGFPSILLFDVNQKTDKTYEFALLGKTGYTKTVGQFTGDIENMMELRGQVSEKYVVAYDPSAPIQTPQSRKRATKKVEPPQNAKGVWHYTCPGGCDGGAGKEQPCKGCGKQLRHNAVYHQ